MGNPYIREVCVTPQLIPSIANFMKSSNFLWDDTSVLTYMLCTLNNPECKQILVYDDKDIVGCNFFIYTKAQINGKYEDIAWSNSTFLSPYYRKAIGLDFYLSIYERNNVLGFGVTPINLKLLRLIKASEIGSSYAYKIENRIYNKFNSNNKIIYPLQLTVRGKTLKRVYSASEIKTPNNGFWFNDKCIDFIRDTDFIQRRFFKAPWKYMIYRLSSEAGMTDELYFVCRIRKNKGVRSLFLVDYRYTIGYQDALSIIIGALKQISTINNLKEILIFLSDNTFTEENLEKYGDTAQVVTNISKFEVDSVIVTPADSDCDLIPLNI